MYKTVIIDDEPIIRKGIRSVLNWEQLGCTICGEASDGQQGMELIERLLPDIIITDIKMPQVDGLTMVRNIRRLVPDSRVIILTGYRDFDYAYQAIKLEAFDFILKPTRIEQLYDVVRRAVQSLKEQSTADSETQRIKQLYEKNLPVIRERYLYNLLTGVSAEMIPEEGRQLGLAIGRYVLIAAECESRQDSAEEPEEGTGTLARYGVASAFEETFGDLGSVQTVSINSRRMVFILMPRAAQLQGQSLRECCYALQQVVKQCFGFTLSLAVSHEDQGIDTLCDRFHECCEALARKFYLGENALIFCDEAAENASDDHMLYELRSRIFELVKDGDADGASACAQELLSCINGMGLTDKEFIRKFYFDTITVINTIRASAILTSDARLPQNAGEENLYQMIERCDSTADLNGLLESIVRRAAAKIAEYAAGSMKLLLRRTVDYLNQNYAQPVTLGQVAAEVYASPSYISRLFKKELGVNFVDYLNEIRIARAKDLLGSAEYKAYEVADLVGIPNPHYFSKLFKRYVGMTPSEYRELLGKPSA